MAYSMRDYLVKVSGQIDGINEMLGALGKVDAGVESIKKKGGVLRAGLKKLVSNLGDVIKHTTNFATSLVKQTVGFTSFTDVLARGIDVVKDYAKDAVELADGLEETAKSLGKTQEKARAHEIALKAMGKTMSEIEKSASLKKTYNDLVKLGEELEFTKAKDGTTNIGDLKDSLSKLKVAARYGLSQVYEYFKIYASKPLKQLGSWISGLAEKLGANIDDIGKRLGLALGKGLRALMKFGESAVKVGTKVYEWGKKLVEVFQSWSPTAKAASLGVVAAIGLITGAFKPITIVLLALWLLIDDFVTWNEGGASAFGDAWYTVIEVLQGVWAACYFAYSIVANAWALIKGGIEGIKSVANLFGADYIVDMSFINDFVNPADYKTTEIGKALQSILDKRDENAKTKSEYVPAGDMISEQLYGGGNNYPDYSRQNGNYNETHEEKNLTVNNDVNVNIINPDGGAAGDAVNNAVMTETQHNLQSAYD